MSNIIHKIPLGKETNKKIIFDIFGTGAVTNIKNIDNTSTNLLCWCKSSKSILFILILLYLFHNYYNNNLKIEQYIHNYLDTHFY